MIDDDRRSTAHRLARVLMRCAEHMADASRAVELDDCTPATALEFRHRWAGQLSLDRVRLDEAIALYAAAHHPRAWETDPDGPDPGRHAGAAPAGPAATRATDR